ncbi:MAG TPA: alpha/beta hydrolase [Candidatus Angelobacter sp.]|nr:alpha/beta hydrolase [Candidatus Angelobacter sp.]
MKTLLNHSRISIRGSGPAIVLVPGMDGTGELFYRQVPLLEKSHTVVTYSLPDEATSMDTLTDDLRGVIELAAPADRRAIVMGESFGGTVALSTALRYPEHISGLVVLNSFPYFAPQFRLRLASAGIGMIPWGAMSVVRRLTSFFMHSRHTHREELRKFLELTSRSTKLGYRNRLNILKTYDVRDRLRELKCPTLFLAAENDHLIPSVAQARLMAERTSCATIRVLTGHGHICLIAPDLDMCQILKEWQTLGSQVESASKAQ